MRAHNRNWGSGVNRRMSQPDNQRNGPTKPPHKTESQTMERSRWPASRRRFLRSWLVLPWNAGISFSRSNLIVSTAFVSELSSYSPQSYRSAAGEFLQPPEFLVIV